MPRHSRQTSSTKIYHVMLRGINRQDIFEDKEDYLRFLRIIRECKEISEFELYAYCIMSNHVHFLIKAGKEPLDLVFKRIGCRFVYWYNTKYERSGHLFQDRYKSEIIENEASFLRVLRYIIQNPLKAGMENSVGTYQWSSYNSYLGKDDHITDTAFATNMFGNKDKLIKYLKEENEDTGLEILPKRTRVTDEQAKEIIKEITGCCSVSEYQTFERKEQKEFAGVLRKMNLSLSQISRMTGMSRATVCRS